MAYLKWLPVPRPLTKHQAQGFAAQVVELRLSVSDFRCRENMYLHTLKV